MIESAARRLASELVDRRESINRELSRNGVRFGIYKNGEYHDRLFPYDPIPRIIESDEFDRMEAGLKQRVNALNAYLRDIYSDKQAIKDGIVPEEYVYTSAGYFPQVNGVTPPGGVFAHVAGEDLVQGQDGQWWVLEDNLRIPSGASYPLFARDIERRITPSLFRNVRVRDNHDYPRLLRQSMDFVSTDGIAVVLTPGRYNSAFFEHAYLAEKTGAALAFPEDLEVVDNKVYFLDYAGRKHRVGVVYRRLSDEYLDPFAFNPDSVIGVPGILSAYRSGNVAIVNAPGNGAADDKAIYYFVPNMIRYYLAKSRFCTMRRPTCRCSTRTARRYSTGSANWSSRMWRKRAATASCSAHRSTGRNERNWPNASRPNRAGSSRRRSSNSRTSTWWTPKPDR